jgi:hypothetical protein
MDHAALRRGIRFAFFWGIALFFVYCARVQLNDVDAAPWTAIYATAALLCAAASLRPLPLMMPLGLGGASLFFAGVIGLRVFGLTGPGSQSILDSEEGREMLGLLLIGLAMVFVAAVSARVRTARAAEGELA